MKKRVLLVALVLWLPSAALAVEGAIGIQTANIDSITSPVVVPSPGVDFRYFSIQLTVDPNGLRSGLAADCTSATIFYVSDPTQITIPSAITMQSLDQFDALYSSMLGGALLDKQIVMSYMEGGASSSCTTASISILTAPPAP